MPHTRTSERYTGTEGEKGLGAVHRVCAPCTRSLRSTLPRPRAPLITCPGVLALESYTKPFLLSLWAALIHSRAPEPFRSLGEKRVWHGLGCGLLRGRQRVGARLWVIQAGNESWPCNA